MESTKATIVTTDELSVTKDASQQNNNIDEHGFRRIDIAIDEERETENKTVNENQIAATDIDNECNPHAVKNNWPLREDDLDGSRSFRTTNRRRISSRISSSRKPDSTRLDDTGDDTLDETEAKSKVLEWMDFCPRTKACMLMVSAMSLHLGGYEFMRSAALALFTSNDTGFRHPSAYPLAIGLVTPLTMVLLYLYGVMMKSSGPQQTLQKTSLLALAIMFVGGALVALLSSKAMASSVAIDWIVRGIVFSLFVFQQSYNPLLLTQYWSFLGSVMTPSEGTKWFTFVIGWSSIVCTTTSLLIRFIANVSHGLLLLIGLTCVMLGCSTMCANKAYQLSVKHGFDPSEEIQAKKSKAADPENPTAEKESLLAKTKAMFQTSPTLSWLFGEVITFKSLSSILEVCFVHQLQKHIAGDGDRATFMGQFSAAVNGTTILVQFLVLPLLRKYLEPKWIFRLLPGILMPVLLYVAFAPTSQVVVGVASATSAKQALWVATLAYFTIRLIDFGPRSVATELVYQPLDFDARYLGKEVIGVFASKFGKSGTSLLLSGMASLGLTFESQLALGVGGVWTLCGVFLSQHVVSNEQAELEVQQQRGTPKPPGDRRLAMAFCTEDIVAVNSAISEVTVECTRNGRRSTIVIDLEAQCG